VAWWSNCCKQCVCVDGFHGDPPFALAVTHPWGLRSRESSMLCWKLGEPRSGAAVWAEAEPTVALLRPAGPLGHAFGGLVTKKLSDSDKFFTWYITPGEKRGQ